jgi:hypothetical protein
VQPRQLVSEPKDSVAVVNSMQGGRQQREVEVVGSAMPLAACCGVMPLGGDGVVMPPRGDIGAMLVREGDGHEGLFLL